jgi:hypothetical protein
MCLVKDRSGYRGTIGLGHADAEPNHESENSDLEHRVPPFIPENRVQPIRAPESKENLKNAARYRTFINISLGSNGWMMAAVDRGEGVPAADGTLGRRRCSGALPGIWWISLSPN